MAITPSDQYTDELFSVVFTISGGDATATQGMSLINSGAVSNSRITLTIVCAGLDSDVVLSQLEGNIEDVAKMSPVLDATELTPIADTLSGSDIYVIFSEIKSFFLGLSLAVGSATTGTVTITGRA